MKRCGNHSNAIPRTWQEATEGTGGVFSQQKSDTSVRFIQSGRALFDEFPYPKIKQVYETKVNERLRPMFTDI